MSMWMQNPGRYGPAAGPIFSELYKQPGVFAGALSNNYNSYAGGLANIGKSFSDAFGSYGAGIGSLATARANENSARYGSNAMAEAARQGALANLGAAGLGAFGSAANSALNAWAANQQAYNRAASDMHTANQQAMGNVGVSRNNALGAMSGAYGGIGKAQVGADALSNFSLGFGGGGGGSDGFSATGPGGPIAGGSYGGGSSGGGGGLRMSGSAQRGGGASASTLSALAGLQGNVMDADIPNRLDSGAQAGRDQLDNQHYSSRAMPSDMLGQTLSGLMALGVPAYGQMERGMNEFYSNNRPNDAPYGAMLGELNTGFRGVGRQLGGAQRDMSRGFGTANAGVNDLWARSLANSPEFQSPAAREIAARAGTAERAVSRDMSRLDSLSRLATSPYASAGQRNYYAGSADRIRRRLGLA